MTANPNQHWRGKNHTSVSRFVTRIVGSKFLPACKLSEPSFQVI